MNRIVVSPSGFRFGPWLPVDLDRLNPGFTYASIKGPRDRPAQHLFLEEFVSGDSTWT
jgi:hypothetical protein